MLIKGNCSKCVLQVINMIYETQLIFYLRIIFLISSICTRTTRAMKLQKEKKEEELSMCGK